MTVEHSIKCDFCFLFRRDEMITSAIYSLAPNRWCRVISTQMEMKSVECGCAVDGAINAEEIYLHCCRGCVSVLLALLDLVQQRYSHIKPSDISPGLIRIWNRI